MSIGCERKMSTISSEPIEDDKCNLDYIVAKKIHASFSPIISCFSLLRYADLESQLASQMSLAVLEFLSSQVSTLGFRCNYNKHGDLNRCYETVCVKSRMMSVRAESSSWVDLGRIESVLEDQNFNVVQRFVFNGSHEFLVLSIPTTQLLTRQR